MSDTESMQQFIRDRVVVDGAGCWIWNHTVHPTGYGQITVRVVGDRWAHRASHIAFIGPIPTGLHVDHLCCVRACVNPAHLEAVTPRTNYLRAPNSLAALNVAKTHCPQDHPYDDANTYSHRDGKRDCRTCRRAACRRYRANRKLVSA